MASNIDGRARQGSGPGLPGWNDWPGLGRWLARRAEAARTEAGEVGVSPGVAIGAARPVDQDGARVELRPREVCTARLSAAADDAEELAREVAGDARAAIATACSLPADAGTQTRHASTLGTFEQRAGRLARLAYRLAVQASALRELADAVQAADGPLCEVCGERPPEDIHGRICMRCAFEGRR